MSEQFSRTQLLLGAEAMESLYSKRVAVFGIGGVGGWVPEINWIPAGSKSQIFMTRRSAPGSTAFVPAVAGLMIAGEIVKDLSCSRK